jgi:glycosyltransferase involved in cell wall biosynthesis
MAMSCPVIATNVGAIPQMLDCSSDNPCGICINSHNVEELSKAIIFLLKNKEIAMIMAKNGFKRVLGNYTLSKIAKLYENIWNEACVEYY